MLSRNRTLYGLVWILCILGSWSILPYASYLGLLPEVHTLKFMLVRRTIESGLFFGVICYLCYRFVPKTDLNPFQTKSILVPGAIAGVLVGLTLFFFDRVIFGELALVSGAVPPFWAGALASIYGSVNEEVLLRLFLFSAIYLGIRKLINQREIGLWSTNFIVALLFGLGHLPAAAKLVPLSAVEVYRVLFLNGIAGLVFGWVYWSRGLWSVMIAHFIADVILHVILI